MCTVFNYSPLLSLLSLCFFFCFLCALFLLPLLLSVFCLHLPCPPTLWSIVTLCITPYSSRGCFFFCFPTAQLVESICVQFDSQPAFCIIFRLCRSSAALILKMEPNRKMSDLDSWCLVSVPRCNVRGEDRRVLGLELDRDHHALFVAFSSCVIRVPLSRCADYSTCKK